MKTVPGQLPARTIPTPIRLPPTTIERTKKYNARHKIHFCKTVSIFFPE